MEKRGLYLFFIITLFLILIPLINAQPPFAQNPTFTNGYEIKIPLFRTLRQNEDFRFSFHVYNISNGVPIDNSTTNCNFHLYNSSGEHIVEGNNFSYTTGHGAINEWEILILGGNFSDVSSYSYLVSCNSPLLGGFESISFEVTTTGDSLETPNSIIYLILSINALLLFLLCLYGGIALPFKNERDDERRIVSIQKLKYFKVGLLFLSYVLFVWLANLLFALANNFPIIKPYTAFFEMVFTIMIAFSFPLFVLMLIIMSILAWKDLQLRKLLSRGARPQ